MILAWFVLVKARGLCNPENEADVIELSFFFVAGEKVKKDTSNIFCFWRRDGRSLAAAMLAFYST